MIEHIPPGYTTLDELPKFTWVAMLNLLGQGTDVKILEAHGQVSDLGIDVLVDVSWEETHGSGKDQRTVTIYRTLCFMHRPEFKLPQFKLNNAEGFFSSWVHKGSGTVDMVKLQFPDRTELNKRYSIASPVPGSCELLFTDVVLDELEKYEGTDGIGNHNGIMTWRKDDGLLTGMKRSQLAVDSKAIFTSIVDDSEAGQRIAAAMPGSYAEEMVNRLEADRSKTARKLLEKLVRREQVDHLASQAVPRVPEPSIVRRTLGMNTIVVVAGVLMAAIGFPIAVSGLFIYPLFKWPDWWISLAIILVGVAGSLMIF
ncbi:MAG: hypothetical protein VX527_05645 [Planctomycetota bacterium]|nr:hypothetical protein [Planctomycetota bacterium]